MSKIDTVDNRFHALKFALQTPVADYRDALAAAEAYLRFLDGQPDPAPAPEQPCCGENEGCSRPNCTGWERDTDLADLTESYPAYEPVAVVDSWAAADHAISDTALVQELFEEGPHIPSEAITIDGAPVTFPLSFDEPTTIHFSVADGWETPEPTFEYVAAAVEQIASPPPPTPDATDDPELTDEQVERVEERLAEATANPERELETVGAYINPPPRKIFPWIG